MRKKFILVISMLLLLSCNGIIPVEAMETGFTTEELTLEDQQRILKNIQLSLLEEEPLYQPIECFDVNDQGYIALGLSGSSENFKTIGVYNAEGIFQYGYSFQCGGSFGLEWDGENLIIYFVRSDLAVLVNKRAECLEMGDILKTWENTSYWNHVVHSRKREVGEYTYQLKNDMGILNIIALSYSQLVKIDAEGNETYLYDINDSHLGTTIFWLICILVFISICMGVVIRYVVKGDWKTNPGGNSSRQ